MIRYRTITTPFLKEDAKSLHIGEHLLITGTVYTARDAAHKRMIELLRKGETLPISLENQIIYYVGPSPAKPGYHIGSAGPTTGSRMDAYTPGLLQQGITGMIGKGKRSVTILDELKTYGAVYFATIAGAGALLSQYIEKYTVIAYPELGPEALGIMRIKNFPVIVVGDTEGRDFYVEGPKQYLREIRN